MTSRDIKALTILECVMARPGMYTPNGTLEEVISFLEGYRAAKRPKRNKRPKSNAEADENRELAGLLEWLHDKAGLSVSEPVNTSRLASNLRRRFKDDSTFFTACRTFLERRATETGA